MSCFPEWEYARYLDGESAPEQARPLEAHLVHCLRCRALVLALREETEVLGELLRGRTPAARLTEAGSAAAGRSHALGLALTLVALAAGAAASAAWLDDRLPDAWSPRGVSRMALDLVFMARAAAPAVFDLGLPIAAMASASALLSFALGALRRRIGGPGAKGLAALALLLAPGTSQAHFGFHEHEDVSVPAGTVHEGTLVASARSVAIDGVVDGDLVALAERVTVRGEVHGNVIALAQTLELRGVVDGSVLLVGERAMVSGEVRREVYAAGDAFQLLPGGRIGRDAMLLVDDVVLEGGVGRDVNLLFAGRVEVRGSVGRQLRARAESVSLLAGAHLGGDVLATLPPGVEVERSGAEVAGEVRVDHRDDEPRPGFERFLHPEPWAWMLLHVGAGFVLGMLVHWLAPGVLAVRAEAPRDLLRALGVGLATLVVAPLGLAAAALTIVGLPVALIGCAALATALYVGLVAVCALVGSALVRPEPSTRGGFGASLAAGLALLVVLTQLPFLGAALRVVAVVVGLGLLVERGFAVRRARAAWTGA